MSEYGNDFLLEPGVEVKQESPFDTFSSYSASVPIPQRRPVELGELRDFNVDLDLSLQDNFAHAYPNSAPNILNKLGYDNDSTSKNECFRMDDDDIFQVDKADLILGPTLAELNANPDSLLDDLNIDDLLLPEENSYCIQIGGAMGGAKRPGLQMGGSVPSGSPCSPYGAQPTFSPSSQHSSASSSFAPLPEQRPDGFPELTLGQSVPLSSLLPSFGHAMHHHPQLSSSAPTHLSRDQIWQRREPRKHLLSTSSVAEALGGELGSVSSLSGGVLSPHTGDSQDEDDRDRDRESDDDSDRYEDLSSDDSDGEAHEAKHSRSSAKKERYFWQYNLQAKGPKGQRLVLKTKMEDPHVLNCITDPVFSPICSVRGIKHSGKARKGDGNDLTPNPRKLFVIGRELDNLTKIINDMVPVSELPFNVRPKSRKEKNKMASRACRLKKKAQHEANKLKLHGLEAEHKRLLNGIAQMKLLLAQRMTQPQAADWAAHAVQIHSHASEIKVASRTSEFVNKILDNVKAGQAHGGLNDVK